MAQAGCNPCGKTELDLESVPYTQVAIAEALSDIPKAKMSQLIVKICHGL